MIAIIPNTSLFTKVRVASTAINAAKLVMITVSSNNYRTYGGLTIKSKHDGREVQKELGAIAIAISISGVTIHTEKAIAFDVVQVEESNLENTGTGYVLYPDATLSGNVFYGTNQFVAKKALDLVNSEKRLRIVNTNHEDIPHTEDALVKALSIPSSNLYIFNRDNEEQGRIQALK